MSIEDNLFQNRMEASSHDEWKASYFHDADALMRDAAGHLYSSELREREGDQSRCLTALEQAQKENEALKQKLVQADKTCQMYQQLASLGSRNVTL